MNTDSFIRLFVTLTIERCKTDEKIESFLIFFGTGVTKGVYIVEIQGLKLGCLWQ